MIIAAPAQSQNVETAATAGQAAASKKSNLPRFVSLKADRVNVRKGPSTDHGVSWIYRRLGLPVEILQSFENWRQVRDSEGAEGWVFYRLLSERRTALITPWQKKGEGNQAISIYAEAKASSAVVVRVETGVIANIVSCDGTWCKISLNDYRGWIEQEKLWGVYPGEKVTH